jgi:hypothetical protein
VEKKITINFSNSTFSIIRTNFEFDKHGFLQTEKHRFGVLHVFYHAGMYLKKAFQEKQDGGNVDHPDRRRMQIAHDCIQVLDDSSLTFISPTQTRI